MKVRLLVIFGVVALLGAAGFMTFNFVSDARGGAELHGTYFEPSFEAKDFELTSADGRVRLSDLKGKVVVLFFGYTLCPDVCPLTMVRLGQAMEELGADAERVQVVMVTVDPERDTPERLAEYVRAFHPSFIGLSGTREEVDAVAAAYGIYHAKAEGSDATGYLVDHTASVTVIDRGGGVRLIWPFDVGAEELASDLKFVLRK